MSNQRISRRALSLGALGALIASLGAESGVAGRRRFLFVHAQGGWDPLLVFAPMFHAPGIVMDPSAEPMQIGNLKLVDGPERPNVSTFFQRFGAQTLVLNGLATRSVNHQACAAIANTGSLDAGRPDWATILGASRADEYHLPHITFDAPLFPGPHARVVARADGMLTRIVDGSLSQVPDQPVAPVSDVTASRLDQYLASEAHALARAESEAAVTTKLEQALLRSHALVEAKASMHLEQGNNALVRADNAVRMLANGVARVASFTAEGDFDSHGDNDAVQKPLLNDLFGLLMTTLDRLATTPAPDGAPLADNTVIVVLSEMARTPAYNESLGRDHWPFTTAMLIGRGVTGDRAIGGYTDGYFGIGVDPTTAEPDPARTGISAEVLGATLLALGGVDPAAVLPGAEPITAVLT